MPRKDPASYRMMTDTNPLKWSRTYSPRDRVSMTLSMVSWFLEKVQRDPTTLVGAVNQYNGQLFISLVSHSRVSNDPVHECWRLSYPRIITCTHHPDSARVWLYPWLIFNLSFLVLLLKNKYPLYEHHCPPRLYTQPTVHTSVLRHTESRWL